MHTVLPKRVLTGSRGDHSRLADLARDPALDPAAVFARLSTCPAGLTSDQAAAGLAEHGPNVLVCCLGWNVTVRSPWYAPGDQETDVELEAFPPPLH